ncbi:MAG: CBS domain-containing protein [Nitrococcus mobilis]|nr:CBS domain-containing protein [Nitrococcus mobilis]
MTVGEHCNRQVIVIAGEESIKVAAQLMRKHHVGDVVLVEERKGKRVPIGIVTDRDLVVEVMAPGLAPETLAVRDIVVDSPFLVREEDSLFDVLEMMRGRRVRRVPVVDADGALVGIIAVDDLIGLLAEMLDDLAAVVGRQREREIERRP